MISIPFHKQTKYSIPVWYKLRIFPVPPVLQNLNRLHGILILLRILSQKFIVMSKDQLAKLTGAICNVLIDTSNTVSVLLREAESNGLVVVRLKRKSRFRGDVYFKDSLQRQYIQHYYIKNKIDLPNDLNLNLTDKVNEEMQICVDTQEKEENRLSIKITRRNAHF